MGRGLGFSYSVNGCGGRVGFAESLIQVCGGGRIATCDASRLGLQALINGGVGG